MFSVQILGCGSAAPSTRRWPTAQVVQINGNYLLIDCGEGTQMLMRQYGVKFQRISHIFISHLHGDHFFGLPGLISTMQLLGREKPLEIHGPKGLKAFVDVVMQHGEMKLGYELTVSEYPYTDELLVETPKFTVHTIPLKHRIATCGFLIREQPGQRNIIKGKVSGLNLPKFAFPMLKQGEDVTIGEKVFRSDELTSPPSAPRSYAYCSDTSYNPEMVPLIKGASVLYHESTFLSDREDLAKKTAHSTARQAAQIASEAEVEKLVLGHYSNRYSDLSHFKEEASEVFENVILGEEGLEFIV